jgi:hypothetical protein
MPFMGIPFIGMPFIGAPFMGMPFMSGEPIMGVIGPAIVPMGPIGAGPPIPAYAAGANAGGA